MDRIELPRPTLETLARLLKNKLGESFGADIGQFEAVELVDYIAETMGPHFYNQGLQDAQDLYRKKFEEISDAVFEIEKPVKI